MSKGKISYFPAHHLRRNSIGQQYERCNWKRLMGAILRTGWSAIFDLFRTLHGKGERLCPGGSFAAVLDAVSSPVQRALHSFTKMHLDWLEDIVREGVARGQFTIGEQRPRDVAVQIFASVQGALIPGPLISDPARHRCGRGRAATFFGLRCNGGPFPGGAPALGSHDL